jgi:hypothetical protein
MAELIQQYKEPIEKGGVKYLVRAYGEPRSASLWSGWLEFHPVEDTLPVLRTGQETSQPDRGALAYWASGLEELYFDGAFQRARKVA